MSDPDSNKNNQITSYAPNVTTLYSRRSWEMFKLWIALVLIIVVVWLLIYLANGSPLDKNDLVKYVNVENYTAGEYVDPNKLKLIDIGLIPNLTDYSEMNYASSLSSSSSSLLA